MKTDQNNMDKAKVSVVPVDESNWRDVSTVEVDEDQRDFVAKPLYYLALCNYGRVWHPLAINAEGRVIGLMMWARDESDGSCWFGGITIDHNFQGLRYGRGAVLVAMDQLATDYGFSKFALSYNPENLYARKLYQSLGFSETGEMEDKEVVARLTLE